MKSNISSTPKIGVISVTDAPREQGLVQEREEYINGAHRELIAYLNSNNIEAVDVSQKIERPNPDWVSIHSISHARECIKVMANEDIEALVIGCWHWCEPMLILALVREFNKPVLLYSDGNPAWAGVTLITAAGASLWQNAANPHMITHKRVYIDKKEVVKWAKGVAAIEKLKKGTLVLWGNSYALKMEYLQDDYSKLKSFLIGEIINEDQYMLIRESENIPKSRLKKFADWLKNNKTVIKFDSEMLTEEIFYKQIALYLAAKDRIGEFEDIAGVSVKCFVELSDVFGADACFLPSFLPYFEDSEGEKDMTPCVCEGDIKALICSSLLKYISGGTPSLFGDVLFMGDNYLVMGNCGGSSIYYSCLSRKVSEVLPKLTIAQNFEGRGGAVAYNTPRENMFSMVRLLKIKDEYVVLTGMMKTMEITDTIRSKTSFYRNWPLSALKFDVDRNLLVDALGANHLIGIPGDFTTEITYAFQSAGIKVFRMDTNKDIMDWKNYYIDRAKRF